MRKLTLAILILLTASFIWGANLINEDISTWTNHGSYGTWTQSITAGTVNMTQCIVANAASATGTCTAGRVQMNKTTGILELPALSSAGTAEFHLAAGSTGRTVKLQSYVGSTWTDLTTFSSISTTGATYTYNVNSTSSTTLRLSSPNNAVYVHDIIITDYSASSPLITVTGSLNAFTTVAGTVSSVQSYKISGSNLTASITVTAPTNFELSKSSGGTYTSGLTFTQSSGSVSEQDVFVRIAASAGAGSPAGDITHTSTGATQVDKAVSGTVYKTEPTNHATTFIVATGTPSYSVIDAVWDDATGTVVPDGYLVKGSDVGYSSIADPVDGTAEANSALVKNVAAGVEYASFTGLTEHTTYYFKIFPYTNSGTNIAYKTNDTVPTDSEITAYGPPAAPTADNATAISHEGFTARWDAVSGATSYRMDVLEGSTSIATDLFISEYLEGSSNNKYIEIFNGTGASVDLSAYSLKQYNGGATTPTYTLTFSSTPLANGSAYVIGNSSGTIYTPNLSTSSQVMQFNGNDAVALFNGANLVDVVGTIGDSSDWGKDVTLVRKATATVPNTSYSATDWDLQATNTITFLGSHTMGAAPVMLSGWNNTTVNNVLVRIDGLDPSTEYQYVVRAVNAVGTSANSNPITVTTGANTAGAGANTAIGGASTVVIVPPLPTFTNNSVEIDPDTSSNDSNDDFTVTVAQIATGITYTISTSNNLALNGVYLLNHAGFGAAPDLSASVGSLSVDASDADASIVTISGISAKGDLVITAEGESTLPVELSSFTATMTVQNTVNLMWVTQSETNVNGYYVHRGVSTELTGAEVVSPLILASNTSQQHYYQFTDSDLFETGTYYYWLEAQDLDGTTAYHGPITLQYNNNNNTPPTIPLTTELKTVYPNPFNPSTTISYGLSKQAVVNFTIYNARGQVVRNFNEGTKAAGNHNILWNGIDNNGRICGTGVYFINMQAGKDSFIRKAVLMK